MGEELKMGGFLFKKYNDDRTKWTREELISYFKARGWEVIDCGKFDDGTDMDYLFKKDGDILYSALLEEGNGKDDWELICEDRESKEAIDKIKDDSMIVWACYTGWERSIETFASRN